MRHACRDGAGGVGAAVDCPSSGGGGGGVGRIRVDTQSGAPSPPASIGTVQPP
jgi:hypothetical protein